VAHPLLLLIQAFLVRNSRFAHFRSLMSLTMASTRIRSFFKLTFLLFASWLFLIVLWIALPSPIADGGDGSAYATKMLESGNTLTRVYEFVDSYHVEMLRSYG
jgi:hypothetical protein